MQLKRLMIGPLCCASAVLLTACQNNNAATSDLAVATGNEGNWTCPSDPGTAPTGELTAQRIDAADSRRTEPGLYEGPVWLDGVLYFSDFTFASGFPSRIQRLTPEGVLQTAIEDSGSNGLALDGEGNLLAATHDRKAISVYNPQTGERDIVVDQYRNNAFNSPNDLARTRNGIIFFTDPDFQREAAPGGQPATQVFRVDGDAVSVVDDTMQNPNGISLSPDEGTLYVAGGGEEGTLRAYALNNGWPDAGRDIASLSVPDGMAVDCLGNIYATEHSEQRLRVFSPEGEQLATIAVDANVTNAAFGGPDRKTLFITGAGAVWKVDLDVAGLPY